MLLKFIREYGLPWWLHDKILAFSAGDMGLIPGSGRPPGTGIGNPLQCSWLVNPMDRGAWRATVHGAAKSWTWLSIVSHYIIGAPWNFGKTGDADTRGNQQWYQEDSCRNCKKKAPKASDSLEKAWKILQTITQPSVEIHPPACRHPSLITVSASLPPATSDMSSCHWQNLSKKPIDRGPGRCSFQASGIGCTGKA